MLKIYSDESSNIKIIRGLKRRGINAWSARDAGNLGLTDEEQLRYSFEQRACLFTTDDDFLKIAHEWIEHGKEHHGIIYVHPLKLNIGECINAIELIACIFDADDMKNHIEYL